MADHILTGSSNTNQNSAEAAVATNPTVKKRPAVTDKFLNETGSKRFGSAKEMSSEPIAPAAKPTSFGSRSWNRHPAEKSKADMEADAWEKEKMIKINERYNKMISTIAEWVNEKKAKAKLRLERYKNGPERKRARALQEYQNAIARIDKVGGEARALAEERKRNDESKMRMKAKEIRSTGKVPQPSCCRCF